MAAVKVPYAYMQLFTQAIDYCHFLSFPSIKQTLNTILASDSG